jgi:hypothetical protein
MARTPRYTESLSCDICGPLVAKWSGSEFVQWLRLSVSGFTQFNQEGFMESDSSPGHEIPRNTTIAIRMVEVAILAARVAGYNIAPGHFGLSIVNGKYRASRGARLCPIGALLVGRTTMHRIPSVQGIWDDAARVLRVPSSWIDEFLSGFDDSEDPCGLWDEAWYAGAAYRKRFCPGDDESGMAN